MFKADSELQFFITKENRIYIVEALHESMVSSFGCDTNFHSHGTGLFRWRRQPHVARL
jgi:hypothetical protein